MRHDANRRLDSLLWGWREQIREDPDGSVAEKAAVTALWHESLAIADGDTKGIAKFFFDRVLYMVLDGTPRGGS